MATEEVEMLRFLRLRVNTISTLLSGNIVTTPGELGCMADSTDIFRGPSACTGIRDHYRIRVMALLGEPIAPPVIEALNKFRVLHRNISLAYVMLVNSGAGLRKGYLIDFDSAIHKENSAHGRLTAKERRAVS